MTVSPSKLIATYLAQEGIEIVRNIRDTNWTEAALGGWDEGLTNCSSPTSCQADYNDSDLIPYDNQFLTMDTPYGFYNYGLDSNTKFRRRITIQGEDLDGASPDPSLNERLRVTVTVSWNEKGKDYSISAWENLYDWH
jgi:hypothetical protein